ncbi:DUF6445 family protein [Paenibacillus elgii]|uniref:DUF6445 family protein n=1 Tax=Paenibacillus elgii TaxID=189691 RepID=UPI00203DF82E|nr:DUF6445 family protein [Paenibacillus elgii]MCM3268659.1 DUF6445 family protein [Paenibacillus elgii]
MQLNLPDDVKIVDNFYSEPYKVRHIALNTDYQTFKEKQNFPGKESKKAYYTNDHINKFESLVGGHICIDPQKYIFGKFRFSVSNNHSRTKVHLDHGVAWTAIVYLSLDKNCVGGLGIYSHKETGLAEAPASPLELQKYDCKNIQEFDQKYVLPCSTDMNAWDLLHSIPIRFNRLIIFPGSKYFHSITHQFGNSIEDGRLTQNFFFN